LQNLGKEFAERGLGGTVFLPPARDAQLDADIAHEMYDPLHVNRISYSQE
jgi:hypothetical protein